MTKRPSPPPEQHEALSLSAAARYLLEESRMVLPGIQALFGFQLIAVFSATFGERLSAGEQQLHLAATFLIAVAVAIIMAPAAYHRQAGPPEVTETFVWLSTRLLLWSMWPLAVGVCLDFYLVSRVILHSAVAPVLAGGLFAIFLGLWFLLPRIRDPRRGRPFVG
jgi:hypothetical protein